MDTDSTLGDAMSPDLNIDHPSATNFPSSPDDNRFDPPLLSNYERNELAAREINLAQFEHRRTLALATFEGKAIADSWVDQFELTGSDVPADANPRQLHLF
jgi:hypothetical protein